MFIWQDFGVSHAGVVVDRQMHIFPANPAAVALTLAIAGDAVADLIEMADPFDVDVNDLAGILALVAARRFSRLQGRELVEAEPLQDVLTVAEDTPTANAICLPVLRCRRKASTAAQVPALFGLAMKEALRSGRANIDTACAEPFDPFGDRLQCRVELARGGGLAQPSSIVHLTMASRPLGVREAFWWMSIRFSRKPLKLGHLQLPRSGPNGQPPENPHLALSVQ